VPFFDFDIRHSALFSMSTHETTILIASGNRHKVEEMRVVFAAAAGGRGMRRLMWLDYLDKAIP
jgi:hypothetical protein